MWSRKRQDAVPAGESISANITGPVSGQVAVGKHIEQHQAITGAPVSDEELAQLRAAFADLAAQVAAVAPPGQHAAAVERVAELEAACLADEPDVTTIQYVGRWFRKNVPALAGAVASIVIHPIVGKLVGAAGDALVAEFSA